MKILILGHNYAPEEVGIAVYTTGMAEFLAAHGHKVHVISGQPYYPCWHIVEGHSAWRYSKTEENGVHVTRVPHYIPALPSGTKRLMQHASFAFAAFFPMIGKALGTRPDIIIAIAPSLVAAPVARLAAMIAGAKSWLHIQDFEVEAAFATGLMKSDNWIARLARWFENTTILSFGRVSTISPQMCKKLVEKGVPERKIIEFRNWADIEAIKPLAQPSPYRAEWNITTPHVALYSGSIANKQGIEIIVEAARLLSQREDLTFVVCGQGPNRAELEASAQGLTNIRFYDLQPRERLNDLLGLATVHLLPQLASAADLVLPSKLANMLASGRPVVATAEPGTGLANEVEGCGLVTPPEDAAAFAGAIETLIDETQTCICLAENARLIAEKRYAKSSILVMFEKQLNNIT